MNKEDTVLTIFLLIFAFIFLFINVGIENYKCAETAKELNYKGEWKPFCGCFLEKQSGEKVLLKNLKFIEYKNIE